MWDFACRLKCPYCCFPFHFCFLNILFSWCLCCLHCFWSLSSVFQWIFNILSEFLYQCIDAMLYNCGKIFFILSFLVVYILSFGLVRLRTIRLSARAGAHIECSSRLRCGGCDNHKCHNKNPRWEMGLGCEWRHARKRWAGILGDFEKKAVSWDLSLGEASWFLKLGEASPVCGLRDACAFVGSVIWDSDSGLRVQLGSWPKNDVETVSIIKIVCFSLSPYGEKLKVKKS